MYILFAVYTNKLIKLSIKTNLFLTKVQLLVRCTTLQCTCFQLFCCFVFSSLEGHIFHCCNVCSDLIIKHLAISLLVNHNLITILYMCSFNKHQGGLTSPESAYKCSGIHGMNMTVS